MDELLAESIRVIQAQAKQLRDEGARMPDLYHRGLVSGSVYHLDDAVDELTRLRVLLSLPLSCENILDG